MIIFFLFLSLILRLINLNQSLWLDEAVQAVVAKSTLAFAFEELKGDFHPPLFHLLMHYWVRIFGSSEIALRLPSVLFGVGTVWVVYKIALVISSHWLVTGSQSPVTSHKQLFPLTAALLMATAPFHIYYSQEARMYSMVTFFTSLSMYYFLKVMGLPKGKQSTLFTIYYLLFTTLALYSDYYAVLIVLAQVIAGTIILRRKMVKLLNCYAAIGLLFLPALPLLITQLKTGAMATMVLPGWGKLVNLNFLKALPLTLVKFSVGRITIFNKKLYGLVMLGILGMFGAVGGWGFGKFIKFVKSVKSESQKTENSEKEYYFTIFCWLVIPIVVAWLASLIIPNYQPFRLLLVLPAFYLLLAYGLGAISLSVRFRVALILILAINLFSLTVYYRNQYFWREDWRGVVKFVKKSKAPLIISAQAFNWPLNYYLVGDSEINVAPGARIVQLSDIPSFLEKISQQQQIIYTPYLADLYDPARLVPKWLEKDGFVKIKEISFNQIPVWEYNKNY